jgi:hypothetical protein
MIGTLAWKDYREHLPVWAAMAGLAIFLIVILTQAFASQGVAAAPAEKLKIIALASIILTASYGLICGAMMLAGEHEARTQTFLDMLPAGRKRLWITKVFAGALFTLAQALVVTGVLVILGLTEVKALPADWQRALPLVGLEAFAYGLFGSVLGRSVLGAGGWALLPLTVGWIAGGQPAWPPAGFLIAARTVFALCMLGLAGVIFCRHDLRRNGGTGKRLEQTKRGERGSSTEKSEGQDENELVNPLPPSSVLYSESWRMLSWLALRQGWSRFFLLSILGFVAGLLLPNAALAIWPVASFLLGVVFGNGMFSGEQSGESYRFLGSQRLPPGQVWLGKAIAWAAMAVGVLGFMILGAMLHLGSARITPGSVGRAWGNGQLLGSPLLFDVVPKDVFLLLWPVYGFSIGQLMVLLFRKSVVALVLSILIGVPVMGIWIPSLVVGALKLWQVLPPAALLLLATRLALWPWVAGLLKSTRSVVGLLACAGFAGVWLAGNLVYRAVGIPDLGEPFDVKSFVAALPAPEQNRAGALIRLAGRELMEQQRLAEEKRAPLQDPAMGAGPGAAGAPAMPPEIGPPQLLDDVPLPIQQPAAPPAPPGMEAARSTVQEHLGYGEPIASLLEKGWPDDDAELKAWLEPLCQGEWIDHLRQAASLPLGVVQDPRLAGGPIPWQEKSIYVLSGELLVARALQIQAAGDHAGALDPLVWALALSRHLRHATTEASYFNGNSVEAMAIFGFDRWLDRLGRNLQHGRELIRRALEELNQHEAETPPATEPIRVEYCLLQDRLDDAARWLFANADYSAPANLERGLVMLALRTPWERERARRFLNALTISRLKEAQTPYWQLPLPARLGNRNAKPVPFEEAWLVNFAPDGNRLSISSEQWEQLLADSRLLHRLFVIFPPHEPLSGAYSLRRVRVARLKLALILYQIDAGKPAQRLEQLVPRYFEEVPVDPFNGRPFRHSDSSALLRNPEGQIISIGQGILESAGPDGGGSFVVPWLPR